MGARNAATAAGNQSSGVPMSNKAIFDKATGRVVAVIVLMIAIAASLRGYLPGAERASQPPPDSGSSLVYVAALLSVSLVIVAVALITRLRDPRRVAPSAGGHPQRFSGGGGRPAWRVVLIGAAVLLVWLLVVWLMSRFFVPHEVAQPQPAPQSGVPTPLSNAPRRPGPRDGGADRDVLHYLIAGAVALLTMIVVGAVATARRRRVVAPRIEPAQSVRQPTYAVGATSLARFVIGVFDFGQPALGCPRQAIIACYVAGAGSPERAGRNRRPQSRTAPGDHRVLRGDGT
jgi:hypothetical protein